MPGPDARPVSVSEQLLRSTKVPSPTIQPPLLFREDMETVPIDEPQDIQAVLEVLRQTLKRQFDTTGRYRRDVHVKGHGCARGEFKIRANLPTELSQGLFSQAASHSVFVRFSNSAPFV